jgi:hypothetical protein
VSETHVGKASSAAAETVRPGSETRLVNDEATYDYGSDGDPDQAAVAKAFSTLDKLTLTAERTIAARVALEEQLHKAKKLEDDLLNRQIPEQMANMRLDKCTTSSGIEVVIKRDIRGTMPGRDRVDARQASLRWLIDSGNGGVIKNNVTVTLDRGEDDRADALVVELKGKGFDVENEKSVHASTLSALIRELIENGKVIPPGTVNVFDQRVAKLSRR